MNKLEKFFKNRMDRDHKIVIRYNDIADLIFWGFMVFCAICSIYYLQCIFFMPLVPWYAVLLGNIQWVGTFVVRIKQAFYPFDKAPAGYINFYTMSMLMFIQAATMAYKYTWCENAWWSLGVLFFFVYTFFFTSYEYLVWKGKINALDAIEAGADKTDGTIDNSTKI